MSLGLRCAHFFSVYSIGTGFETEKSWIWHWPWVCARLRPLCFGQLVNHLDVAGVSLCTFEPCLEEPPSGQHGLILNWQQMARGLVIFQSNVAELGPKVIQIQQPSRTIAMEHTFTEWNSMKCNYDLTLGRRCLSIGCVILAELSIPDICDVRGIITWRCDVIPCGGDSLWRHLGGKLTS